MAGPKTHPEIVEQTDVMSEANHYSVVCCVPMHPETLQYTHGIDFWFMLRCAYNMLMGCSPQSFHIKQQWGQATVAIIS